MIPRRSVLYGAALASVPAIMNDDAASLRSCVIEMGGDWHIASEYPRTVVTRMRDVCLAGVTLRSDRQPNRLYVDNHSSGPPAIWLHTNPAQTAWIITDVGERDWCRLAYQFGHELGHVLANSWQADAAPQPPCQWLEEALVETFSLRGLELLADSWAASPPFRNDAKFSETIRAYRADILARYQTYTTDWGADDVTAWYRAHRATLAQANGLSELVESIVPALLAQVESDRDLLEDYGAMNRWPGRSSVPPSAYLRMWRTSCAEIGSLARLPKWLAKSLGYSG